MNFTTRSSEGSDDLLRNIPYNSLISIHAPARGATTAFFALVKLGLFQSTLPRRERRSYRAFHPLWCYFNPRSREGSDLWSFHDTIRPAIFQSTLPRRERRTHAVYSSSFSAFQSTLPRRERRSHFQRTKSQCYFNPRSREGSDKVNSYFESCFNKFQSTLPRGERLVASHSFFTVEYFNPRSREGSDTDWSLDFKHIQISIHAPARGATNTV